MTQVSNISKQKVIRFIVGTALVCLLLCLLIAATISQRNDTVANLKFNMDLDGHAVITQEEISTLLLQDPATNYQQIPVKDLNLAQIEATLEANPWIRNAEVFINNKNELELDIQQNIPAARIFTKSGETFYIDEYCITLPAAVSFPYPTPVFTNVPFLGDDEISVQLKKKIAYLGHAIGSDTFWNAQVTQINMTDRLEFEMVTLMGDHIVKLGDTNQLADKLNNLMIFYKEGLQKLGWNRYDVVDVRYAGQVVASPAMGYIAPKIIDTAVSLPDDDEETNTVPAAPTVVASTTAATAATAPVAAPSVAAKPVATPKPSTTPKPTTSTKNAVASKATPATSNNKNTNNTKKKETPKATTATAKTNKTTNNNTNNKDNKKRILPPQNR